MASLSDCLRPMILTTIEFGWHYSKMKYERSSVHAEFQFVWPGRSAYLQYLPHQKRRVNLIAFEIDCKLQ